MEAYIIIISAAITAIAIAYKIATNLKNNTTGFKTFPMVMTDGNYVLSFPISSSTTSGSIDPVNAVKVYLKVKEIGSMDIDSFVTIASSINWHSIIDGIINNTEIEQLDYSFINDVRLFNSVAVECSIESEPSIKADILINTDLTININKQ